MRLVLVSVRKAKQPSSVGTAKLTQISAPSRTTAKWTVVLRKKNENGSRRVWVGLSHLPLGGLLYLGIRFAHLVSCNDSRTRL